LDDVCFKSMYLNVRMLLDSPNGRYVIVGGSVYIIEVLVILIAEMFGLTALWAIGLSFWVGLVVSFVLQKLVTFGDRRAHHKILIPQVLAFSLLVAFNFGFTLLFTKIFLNIIPAVLTRTLALGITTLWNFYLYKTKIFKGGMLID
jgi:putative flippase GtrA